MWPHTKVKVWQIEGAPKVLLCSKYGAIGTHQIFFDRPPSWKCQSNEPVRTEPSPEWKEANQWMSCTLHIPGSVYHRYRWWGIIGRSTCRIAAPPVSYLWCRVSDVDWNKAASLVTLETETRQLAWSHCGDWNTETRQLAWSHCGDWNKAASLVTLWGLKQGS